MKAQVIVVAGGLGKRFKSSVPKPLVWLNKKPVFIYCLETFENCSLIDSVIFVGHGRYLSEYSKQIVKFKLKKVVEIVEGGKTRSQSVLNGLKALDKDTQIVLVHDSVRPFISLNLVRESIRQCQKKRAVILAVPVKPTIKKVHLRQKRVEATLDRNQLWEVQTPQTFKKEILLKAYSQKEITQATDDASLVEKTGSKVYVLDGDYRNIKLTTPEDLTLAQTILKKFNFNK